MSSLRCERQAQTALNSILLLNEIHPHILSVPLDTKGTSLVCPQDRRLLKLRQVIHKLRLVYLLLNRMSAKTVAGELRR